MVLLAILFLATAILYSSVGFGGGSTYLALLLIWGVPYFIFPVIALSCNIIVVSGNCFNYIRTGNLNLKLLLPYLIGSIPLAFIGGSIPVSILIGGVLGFISGIVGIGGGIFLSPILFLIRAGRPKHIVTTASLFILINSVSGIIGQLTKNSVLTEIPNYWYLLVAVLIGGQIGNFLNLKVFPTRILALVTSCLVLFVAIRMAYKLFI